MWVIVGHLNGPTDEAGSWLLIGLHLALIGLILVVAPALTADCISRERREGTLGLLFLTPLNAESIVTGKIVAHGLRAFTLWLAVLPILTIPFITGGVTWQDAFSALSLEFCAMALCLGAGLLASSIARERTFAFFLGFSLGAIFLYQYDHFLALCVVSPYLNGGRPVQDANFLSLYLVGRASAIPGMYGNPSFLFANRLVFCAVSPPVVLIIFCGIARFAAWQIKRSWQDKILSRRHESLLRRYCTPLFQRWSRIRMQRSLDRNPIAWLQQYSWKARVGKWGLCLAFLLAAYGVNRSNASPEFRDWTCTAMVWILGGFYTFIGVGSFLEEKGNGALELLLVTPVSANKLIFGRVWGLWKQFVPAGLVLAWFYVQTQWYMHVFGGNNEDWIEALQLGCDLVCGFLTLPVLATYFALRVKNLIVAAALTWVVLCLPAVMAPEFSLYNRPLNLGSMLFVIVFTYGAFALLACVMLRHSLSRRIYSF
jgi:ABC-type transport system involved in multi-copper enzyme maturation permease subunit